MQSDRLLPGNNNTLTVAPRTAPKPVRSIWGRRPEEPESRDPDALQEAQFAIPKKKPTDKGTAPAAPAPRKSLEFEYVWGLETELPFLYNLDLDSRINDTDLQIAPTVFGSVTYRPTDWFETRFELTAEKVFGIVEQDPLTLPNGTQQRPGDKPFSLLVDQLYGRFLIPESVTYIPTEFTVGRRNFEDVRLWLYDAALDAAIVTLKPGDFNIEISLSREDLVDADLTTHVPRGNTNNVIAYAEYRGIEDHKLAAYYIFRDDGTRQEGEPQWFGLRSTGRPRDEFSYWVDMAYVGGKDENERSLQAGAVDIGGIYRFLNLPWQPCFVLGLRYGSGDKDPKEGKNNEFRQTGLQSNEGRFCGLTQFVTYGEAFTPEISNLRFVTAGFGFRPAANVFFDIVYHRYWLNQIANEVRGQQFTARMNEFGRSKDVGQELDIIVGTRNVFGIRGLGLEARAGVFFPGDAWKRNDGSDPDIAVTALGVAFF
ncbi:MAG: alginate export family protein [Alphaproteobacteria bacterium]|nr:alginate export family protein [Alphaproteobacteria bacterium]